MAKPTKPTPPAQALRSEPATFRARAEAAITYQWDEFPTYIDSVADFVNERADEALAAALGGDLPALTGKAGQYIRVNSSETAAEFTNEGAFTTLAASGAATLASTLKIGTTNPVAAAKQTILTGGTVGGTADAVTLTTGLSLPALVTGMSARAMLTSTNTTAMTLNVDGTGAVAIKTVTGADTPAGYIRTDVPTDLYYNGTNWIADRVVESGSNADGEWTRHADGTCTMHGDGPADGGCTTASGAVYRSTAITVDFPITVVAGGHAILTGIGPNRWANAGTIGTTSFTGYTFQGASNATSSVTTWVFTGRWY